MVVAGGVGQAGLEQLPDHTEAELALELPAAGHEHGHAAVAGQSREFVEQCRLADPGWSLDEQHPARATRGLRQRDIERGHVVRTIEENAGGEINSGVTPVANQMFVHHHIYGYNGWPDSKASTVHRSLRRCAMVAAVALLLGACGVQSRDAPSAEPTSAATVTDVRVALAPTGNTLPVELAEQQGIFERHGLQVAVSEGQDLSVSLTALDKGQYEIVMSVPTTVLVGAEQGLDVEVVSRIQQSSAEEPNAVWVTRDNSIDSIRQLAGIESGRARLDRGTGRFARVPVAAQRRRPGDGRTDPDSVSRDG